MKDVEYFKFRFSFQRLITNAGFNLFEVTAEEV